MGQGVSVLLCIYDMPNEFYTFTRASAGYSFDAHRPLDPRLGDQVSAFLQIYKLQNPKATFETAVAAYDLFSWDVVPLLPDISLSQVPHPRVVIVVRAENAKEQAVHMRILLENLPESKKTLEDWFSEIERDKPSRKPARVSQIFNTTVYGGAANLVGTAEDSQVIFDVTTNDLSTLERVLSANSVSRQDITELEVALEEDPPPTSPSRFGPKVSAWLSKMVGKACDGSWGISVGAAGKLLADAITRYYGLQ